MVAFAADVDWLDEPAPGAETHGGGCALECADFTTVSLRSTAHTHRGCEQVEYDFAEMFIETGLFYARARMYSAGLGRFSSRDPYGYIDGLNLYEGYFAPNLLDPSGLECCETLPMGDPGPRREENCFQVFVWDPISKDLPKPQHIEWGWTDAGEVSPTIGWVGADSPYRDDLAEALTQSGQKIPPGTMQGWLYDCCCLTDAELASLKAKYKNAKAGPVLAPAPKNPLVPQAGCGLAASNAVAGMGCAGISSVGDLSVEDYIGAQPSLKRQKTMRAFLDRNNPGGAKRIDDTTAPLQAMLENAVAGKNCTKARVHGTLK